MAFPRLSPSMLLASLILLLYWTTSSARSHDPPSSAVVSPSYRVKRDLPADTRGKVDKSLEVAKSFLTVVKEGFEKIDTRKLSAAMKSLSNVASLAPGVGALVSAAVNMVLIFIPQDDPVLIKVQKGFEEVNRKLDSISIQISDLATDVEWFNYASVYSQDEVRILNSWKKFSELLQNSQSVQSEEEKLRLAEAFTNYYENTGTEASVANFFHYLTVTDTSLSGNLNDLLRRKFKCDVHEIGKYNIYFSRLLWQGMVLNQFYWKLIGLNSSGIETKHTQMFENVYEAQKSALVYCLDNHMDYVKEDVVKIRKGLSADNKRVIADHVKKVLDNKYNWYNWVVMVYNTDQFGDYILYDLTKITEDTITIAVGYTQKTVETDVELVREAADQCLTDKWCEMPDKVRDCWFMWSGKMYFFSKVTKVTHATYGHEFAVAPAPIFKRECWTRHGSLPRMMSMYYSKKLALCLSDSCSNKGTCRRLLDSNEWVCKCWDGYYGKMCEKTTPNSTTIAVDIPVVPDISTIDTKLKMMEVQLKEVLKILNERNCG